jgi:ABC-2 type transport system ATP-binding protein
MSIAIDIRSVVKRYGRFEALRGVSFQVEPGRVLRSAGPQRCRQDHLDHGHRRPHAGQFGQPFRVMGHDVVDRLPGRSPRAGGGAAGAGLRPVLHGARDPANLTSGYYGLRRNDAWIDEILANLDLTSKADANMRALSGGMKRRVLVAQALVHRPPVIVLDEPTAGVDVELRQTLWQFIRRLNRDGHTIVLTTHYLEEAQELCGRIAMLKQGQVVALDHERADRPLLGRHDWCCAVAGPLPESCCRCQAESAAAHARPGCGSRCCASIPTIRSSRSWPALRVAGCVIDEMELQHTDLEDVFLRIMRQENGMSGFSTLFRKEMLRFWKVVYQTVAAPVLTAAVPAGVLAMRSQGAGEVFPGVLRVPTFLVPGPGDDGGAAERVRQRVVVADPVQGHRQHGVRAAAAAVGAELFGAYVLAAWCAAWQWARVCSW